jgi:hypothetical protein
MADGPKPAGAMAIREGTHAARARIELLDADRIGPVPTGVVGAGMYTLAALLVAAPLVLWGLALARFSLT